MTQRIRAHYEARARHSAKYSVKVAIEEHKSLDRSGAIPFVVEGYSQLLKAKLAPSDQLPLHGSYRTLVARSGGEIVGAMCFYVYMENTALWLVFGYVAPKARRHGIYTRLWNKLIAIAKKEKMLTVNGSTCWTNKPLQQFAARVGRVPTSITYEYRIAP